MGESFVARTHGRRVLQEEAAALASLAERLDDTFDQAVALIVGCPGRIVVSGMGKSGHVGRKIAATLASTGTPALFLHPAEAMHGDLGMAAPGDVALVLSNSGESEELRALLPALKRRAGRLIALTGNRASTLAQAADLVLDTSVPREACPLNLAPTTSTTAMLALGDALAVAAMEARGFGSVDYARLHPAGTLGRRLSLRVHDIMRRGAETAVVPETATVREAMFAVTKAGAGIACVVDADQRLSGVFSDGDARRFISRHEGAALNRPVVEAMTRTPRRIEGNPLAAEALERFERESVKLGDLPVVGADGRPVGVLALKDLIRAGIVLPEGGD